MSGDWQVCTSGGVPFFKAIIIVQLVEVKFFRNGSGLPLQSDKRSGPLSDVLVKSLSTSYGPNPTKFS